METDTSAGMGDLDSSGDRQYCWESVGRSGDKTLVQGWGIWTVVTRRQTALLGLGGFQQKWRQDTSAGMGDLDSSGYRKYCWESVGRSGDKTLVQGWGIWTVVEWLGDRHYCWDWQGSKVRAEVETDTRECWDR